jgi:excinuclease ABC subunit A
VIEHNLDVIKTADWIVDLGPEGGDRGGEVVADGPPERVARTPRSYTGQFLAGALGLDPPAPAPDPAGNGAPATTAKPRRRRAPAAR